MSTNAIAECEDRIETFKRLLSSPNLTEKERFTYECDLAYEQKQLQDLKKAVASRKAYA